MPTETEIYGYGTIANLICCICSLGGAVIFPCAKRHANAYHVVLSIFMGLAVGTLGSDAVIHLIPEAFGLHGHGSETAVNETAHEEEDHHEHDHDDNDDHVDHDEGIHIDPYVWYCLIIMAGVYGFYLLEMIMTFFKYGLNSEDDDDNNSVVLKSISSTPIDGFSRISESVSSYTIDETKIGGTNTKSDGEKKCCQSLSSLAIMIIVGDAIHNFADGLAVAAAFSSSILEGISITIAIFCHELPHELGDFAVLIGSGMSFGKALLANLLSSLTAMVGFYVGVPISVDEGARNWIFAITAGMFLYISLVDMLPTLIQKSKGSLKTFIYHNIGIILGALIITILGIFEDKVSV